ncbi:hypothetical protein IE4771_CH01057 [Rhizobium etli bv. mimosae str. IE4771]|uniref:Uncharacterized protein n=2 Tax=Rhizobium etli TaxID=29449 RepID=A0A060I2T0_RHIET|nr:hypothetical protein IE4771_CH01057 [Rhizobium sp. IE4771]
MPARESGTISRRCRSLLEKEAIMSNKDPIPNADPPRGPTPTPGIPDPTQEKPPLTPAEDPADTKNPQDRPLDPALLPIGDPAGAA